MYAKTVKVWLLFLGIFFIAFSFLMNDRPSVVGKAVAPLTAEQKPANLLSNLVTYSVILLVVGVGGLFAAMVFVLKKGL